ncbi:MAG: ABZJ_00895 family protein [Pseudomonadota bacterium]
MTDTQIVRRFAVVTLIVYAAVAAVTMILQAVANYESGAGLGLVTIIVPALEAGQTQARRTGQALDGARMWKLSGIFGLVSLVLSSALAFAASLVLGLNEIAQMMAGAAPGQLALFALVVLAIYILAGRLFLGFGQRLELNRRS